jgi:hypothetical protein
MLRAMHKRKDSMAHTIFSRILCIFTFEVHGQQRLS